MSESDLSPVILARPSLCGPGEMVAMQAIFPVATSRVGLSGRLVIGRMSTLPHYEELVSDLELQGSRLINPADSYQALVDFAWYHLLADITPRTFFSLEDARGWGGPLVVKGTLNSRKLRWNEDMFAPTFADALRITQVLQHDGLISGQPIVYRAYEPLVELERGLYDLPFSNEWRCFCFRGQVLAVGPYWLGMTEEVGCLDQAGVDLAAEAARRVADLIPFAVIDIAETVAGGWIAVEVNDGQMSGLQGVDADAMYAALGNALRQEKHRPGSWAGVGATESSTWPAPSCLARRDVRPP